MNNEYSFAVASGLDVVHWSGANEFGDCTSTDNVRHGATGTSNFML